ncbi:MAG: hypothetical protein J6X55_05425 [Victivallales bacterium]|nr:hypothetical protein [Victivallales bacterium]
MSNVRDYGAVGNGIVKDTRAIQAAIDAGGIVTFTPGVYLTGTLYLHSNSYLEIQAGAVILGSPDMEDYNAADFVQQNVASKAEVTSGGHLIVAVECENVTLTGGGGIDGNQPAFVNEVNEAAPFMYKRSMRPAQMIFFCECTNVHVSNLVLRNSPYWTCFLHGCEEVTITGLHIHSHAMVLNDDGIDIDCCRRVTISDCIIDTGDDSITLRGSDVRLKKKRACEYIVVNNCVLTSRYANAIRVGVGNGVIRCASFNNIVITGYRTAISIVSNWSNDPKSSKGVDISEIDFSNIHSTARRFLNLKLDNLSDGEAKTSATIKDISIRNVRGTMELNNTVRGNGIGMVSGITLDDIRLTNFGKGTASDKDFKGAWGHVSTDASYEISNAKDVIIRNCKVVYPEDSKGWACDCRITDADVSFENTTFNCQK